MFANIRNAFNNHRRRRNPTSSTPIPTRENPPQPQRVPCASMKAIKQLPTIRVQPEDLVDPNNRECCVCLDDNNLDDKVTRLPCAHIFHTCCIVDWLSNHSCTCPICRYELPTDDPRFEAGRRQRMMSRKPRYAMHELKRMPISDLLKLNRRQTFGALERKDLIKILIDDEQIDLVPTPEPVEYKLEVLEKMKIGELKKTMAEAGVFFRREDVLMKSDMISVFENSGRLILIKAEVDESLIVPNNHGTSNVAPINNDGVNSSTLSCDDGRQILVETVQDDSLDVAKESIDEVDYEPTIEMFPNQGEESNGSEVRNSEYSIGNIVNVSPTTIIMESDQVLSLSETAAVPGNRNPMISENLSEQYSATENDIIDEGSRNELSMRSDHSDEQEQIDGDQNPMITEICSEQNSATDNVIVGEGIENNLAMGSDQSGEQDQIDMDLDLLATDDLLHTNNDLRSTFQQYTINDLQTLGRDLQVDLPMCREREEMIDMLVNAGITGSTDPSALPQSMFSSWSVSQLRVAASKFNIDLFGCTNKGEMIDRIIYVGNVERPFLRDYLRSLSPLITKSVSDLRAIAREFQINISDCLERDEIIHRLIMRVQCVKTN